MAMMGYGIVALLLLLLGCLSSVVGLQITVRPGVAGSLDTPTCGVGVNAPCASLAGALPQALTASSAVIELYAATKIPWFELAGTHQLTIQGMGPTRVPVTCQQFSRTSINLAGSAALVLQNLAIMACGGTALASGGVLNVTQSSSVTVNNCMVSGNRAQEGGFATLANQAALTFIRSSVSANSAVLYGGVAAASDTSRVTFQSCTVAHNTATRGGVAIGYASSTVSFHDCSVLFNSVSTFVFPDGTSKRSKGGVLFSDEAAVFGMSNCTVVGNRAQFRAAVIAANDPGSSHVYVSDTIFHDNVSRDGAVLDLFSYGIGVLERVTAYANRLLSLECVACSIFNAAGSMKLRVSDSVFSGNYGSPFWIQVDSPFEMRNVIFRNNTSTQGGALYIGSSVNNVEIGGNFTNAIFTDNLASREGGAIYLEGDSSFGVDGLLLCTNCLFARNVGYTGDLQESRLINNTAQTTGGAIALVGGPSIRLHNATFIRNTAVTGGALYDARDFSEEVETDLRGGAFVFNHAQQGGGAWYYGGTGITPSMCQIGYANYTIIANNTAGVYGPEVATTAASVRVLPGSGNLVKLQESASPISPPLLIGLVDTCGLAMDASKDPIGVIIFSTTAAVSGGAISGQGYARCSDLRVTGMPGSTHVLQINVTSPSNLQPLTTMVHLRECTDGEWQQPSPPVCQPCVQGEFSTYIRQTCQSCVRYGVCPGRDTVFAANGTWRVGKLHAPTNNRTYPVFAACPNPYACLGPDNALVANKSMERCAEGYSGILCGACASGWSASDPTTCAACPEPWVSTFGMFALVFIGSVLAILAIQRQRKSGAVATDLITQSGKIIVSYLQLVSTANSLTALWPGVLTNLFRVQQSVGSAGTSIAFMDCFLQDHGYRHDFYSSTLVYVVGLPVLLFFSGAFWGAATLWRYSRPRASTKDTQYLIQRGITNFVVTSIIVMFMMYPTVSLKTIQVFSCLPIVSDPSAYGDVLAPLIHGNRTYYLTSDAHQQCYTNDHVWWMLRVGIPSLIFLVIGIPVVAYMTLWRLRKQLRTPAVMEKYGFLYTGYSANCYYWETALLVRKTAVIALIHLLAAFGTLIQTMAAATVVFFSFVHHMSARPYDSPALDRMERLSLIMSFCTFSLSTLLGPTMPAAVQILVSIIIIGGNVTFFIYLAYLLRDALVTKVKTTMKGTVELGQKIARRLESGTSFRRSNSQSELSPELTARTNPVFGRNLSSDSFSGDHTSSSAANDLLAARSASQRQAAMVIASKRSRRDTRVARARHPGSPTPADSASLEPDDDGLATLPAAEV